MSDAAKVQLKPVWKFNRAHYVGSQGFMRYKFYRV